MGQKFQIIPKRSRITDREQMLDMIAWRVSNAVVERTKDWSSSDPQKTGHVREHGLKRPADLSLLVHSYTDAKKLRALEWGSSPWQSAGKPGSLGLALVRSYVLLPLAPEIGNSINHSVQT